MMATPDPAHDGLSAEDVLDERSIAVLCRTARFRNTEIHQKRVRLLEEIREIQQRSRTAESRHWRDYQERLAKIADVNPKWSTRRWISAFAENEKRLAEDLAKHQEMLRRVERLKQDEFATLTSEFWGVWSEHLDYMRELTPRTPLTPLPPSSGSTPAAMLPGVAPQPADNQASSALPASHSSGNQNPHGSVMHSTNGQEQSVSGKPSAASKPLPKNAVAAVPWQPAPGLVVHVPLPPVSMPASGHALWATPAPASEPSEPRRRLRSSTAAASPAVQSNGRKTRPKALTPRSPTPTGAPTGVEGHGESSQGPADNAQSAKAHSAVAAGSRSGMASAAVNPVKPTPPALPKLITPQDQHAGFVGVVNPVVGEIYQGFYKDEHYQGWWMCTPLPWEAWEREIGINYSFHQADLFKDLPQCYTTDRVRAKPKSRKMKTVIKGWKKGFEAGGPRARERIFPVLFFDDVPGEPGNFKFPDSPDKVFSFSKQTLRALPAEWIAAADLRLPGVDVGRPVQGRDTAERFRERVRARRTLQAKKNLGTPKKARSGIPSSVEVSPFTEASSVMDRSSAMEDTTREDIEMADAESLSGATAVDDTPGQHFALEALKTPPTAKISLKGTPGQPDLVKAEMTDSTGMTPSSNASKDWRSVVLGEGS